MTEHLYYHDSFLYEFDAKVIDVTAADSRTAVVLDRTAFYPTSGGQIFDTGFFASDGHKVRIAEVSENDDGTILHVVEGAAEIQVGSQIHGQIDVDRRRDHMQQHSGQHVLSAAFVRLFSMPTVSFHMGAESCSIDLDTKNLTSAQVEAAEKLANDVIVEDRPVSIRFVTQAEAQELGLRKVPPVERDQLRLIDIQDFDLTACGGTHVLATGQIGCILLRNVEKVRQGWRIEFVCGKRGLATARRDYSTLAEAAGLCSSHIWDLPKQVRKYQEETRNSRKTHEQTLQELAQMYADRLLRERGSDSLIVTQIFADRDLAFIKLVAQSLTHRNGKTVALLASTSAQPALVFAQSPGQPFDLAALMKEALSQLGGRGGGSKDMAQGGFAKVEAVETVLAELAAKLRA
jgi:alanyl-tRNA synthetase